MNRCEVAKNGETYLQVDACAMHDLAYILDLALFDAVLADLDKQDSAADEEEIANLRRHKAAIQSWMELIRPSIAHVPQQ